MGGQGELVGASLMTRRFGTDRYDSEWLIQLQVEAGTASSGRVAASELR